MSLRIPHPWWLLLAASAILAVAIGLGIGLPIYRHRAAVHAVERLGGTTLTEEVPPAWLPGWFRERLNGVFLDVWSVDLAETRCSDADLAHLSPLTELRILSLDETEITDRGLARLSNCGRL